MHRRRAWLAAFGVVALVLVAFALRVRALGSSLPHAPEIHERVFVAQVALLERGVEHPERDLDFGFYPHLIARLCTWLPAARHAEPHTLPEHLAVAAAPRLHIRWIVMLASLATLPATYLVARRFLSCGSALLAVALVATSLMHVWFSPQGRPHAPAAAFGLLALAAVLHVRERASFFAYVVAGVALALALATLQNAAALFPAFVVAHWLRRPGGSRFAQVGFVFALVCVAIAVRVFYPFMFVPTSGHDAAELEVVGGRFSLSGHTIDLTQFDGAGFAILGHALWDYDPLLLTLACASACSWAWSAWRRRRAEPELARAASGASARETARGNWLALLRERARGHASAVIVGAHLVTYVIAFGVYGKTLDRFALPLVPYVAIGAAAGVVAVARWTYTRVSSPALARVVAAMPVALVCVVQSAAALRMSALGAARDTSERAADWIERNCDRSQTQIAALTSTYLPLMRDEAGLASVAHMYPTWIDAWLGYQAGLSTAARAPHAWHLTALALHEPEELLSMSKDVGAFLHGLTADYVVIEDADGRRPPLRRRHLENLRRGLRQEMRLVARFSPWPDGDESDLPFVPWSVSEEATACWAVDAWRARALGPVIEIYAAR